MNNTERKWYFLCKEIIPILITCGCSIVCCLRLDLYHWRRLFYQKALHHTQQLCVLHQAYVHRRDCTLSLWRGPGLHDERHRTVLYTGSVVRCRIIRLGCPGSWYTPKEIEV